MKKKIFVSIALMLTVLTVSMISMQQVSGNYSDVVLTRDILPYRAEILDSAEFESSLIDRQGWWIDIVDADLVSNEGEGIYVAVLDTGLLENYADYLPADRIRDDLGIGFSCDIWWDSVEEDFVRGDLYTTSFYTDPIGSGHGTHMSSVLTGFNFIDTYWFRGVAPKVTIIPVKVLDTWMVSCPDPSYPDCHDGFVRFRGGFDDMIVAGILYVADLAEEYDIKVIINLSLGGPVPSEAEEWAINYAISKGVIVVASAGNDGEFGMGWPGAYPQVISVAAGGWTMAWYHGFAGDAPEKLNTEDMLGNNWQIFLEDFSSRPNKNYYYAPYDFHARQLGKHLDVCTPGQAIVGPFKPRIYWDDYYEMWINPGPSYYYVWGTSPAAPHVSGIAALVMELYPDLDQSGMELILRIAAAGCPLASDGAGCYDLYPAWYDFYWNNHDYGCGLLQAPRALDIAAGYMKHWHAR